MKHCCFCMILLPIVLLTAALRFSAVFSASWESALLPVFSVSEWLREAESGLSFLPTDTESVRTDPAGTALPAATGTGAGTSGTAAADSCPDPAVPLCEYYPESASDPAWRLFVPGYALPYYIRINVLQNVVNIYRTCGDGWYQPYTAFLTSTGTYTLHEGVFAMSDQYEWRELYGGSYGHYASRIYSGLLFHSCPCAAMDTSTVDPEAYKALGTAASLGCMRLRDIDAKWIYENCGSGTLVEFYDSETPGPFGRPVIAPWPEGAVKDPTAE